MIVVAVRDLVFRSKIHAAAERLGVQVRFAPRGTPLAEAVREAPGATVLADLGEPGLVEQVPDAKRAAPVTVVGYLGHLQEDLMARAAAAGVDEVLTRGQFVARLDDLLRR
jgi:DNA-binding NarL/FixJ family response regulator